MMRFVVCARTVQDLHPRRVVKQLVAGLKPHDVWLQPHDRPNVIHELDNSPEPTADLEERCVWLRSGNDLERRQIVFLGITGSIAHATGEIAVPRDQIVVARVVDVAIHVGSAATHARGRHQRKG